MYKLYNSVVPKISRTCISKGSPLSPPCETPGRVLYGAPVLTPLIQEGCYVTTIFVFTRSFKQQHLKMETTMFRLQFNN